MNTISKIHSKVIQLKKETKSNMVSTADQKGKEVLETTYEVLAGLEEALGIYAKG